MKAIVTGAASGIGRACAQVLAAAARQRGEDGRLLLIDFNAEALEAVARALRAEGFDISTLVGDLSDPAQPAVIADHAKRVLGDVDTLISNAGVISNATLENLMIEDYERSFAVNTRATWLLGKACLPMLKATRGAIVATASISAEEPTSPHGAYSASKAALVMLIRQMAYEFGPDGIRCNCVSPGMIHTGMTDKIYRDPRLRTERASMIPLRRVGDALDVARVVAFLVSPDAAYVTGVNIAVDGGVQTAFMPIFRQAAVP